VLDGGQTVHVVTELPNLQDTGQLAMQVGEGFADMQPLMYLIKSYTKD
jgi:hypothetical protein